MIRRAFLRRMIFAGLATWFLDLPLPVEPEPARYYVRIRPVGSEDWHAWVEPGLPIVIPGLTNDTWYDIEWEPA